MSEASGPGSHEHGLEGTPQSKADRKASGSSRGRKRRTKPSREASLEVAYTVRPWRRVVTFENGLKVTVGKSGRVTLPASVREELDLHEGAELNVQVEAGGLVLTPVVTVPRSYRWAYTPEQLDRLDGALADAEEGRIQPLDVDDLTRALKG